LQKLSFQQGFSIYSSHPFFSNYLCHKSRTLFALISLLSGLIGLPTAAMAQNTADGQDIQPIIYLPLIAGSAQAEAAGQVSAAVAAQTYIVLYKANGVAADAAGVIAKAGGSLVYRYDKIGVVIARSSNTAFVANLLKNNRVEGAAATTNFATQQ
jgi:hypothetical protein